MMKFAVFKGADGQYYFHLKSSNGEKMHSLKVTAGRNTRWAP